MILATDTHYNNDLAVVAGVCFNKWADSKPEKEFITFVNKIQEYEPGQFYKREMPCIIKLIESLNDLPDLIVIDGFVYLGKERKPGLGKHLFDKLNAKIPVIGVAKNSFKDTPSETEIYRGNSKKPLFITSQGIELEDAKKCIAEMHGNYRVPTLLKLVDSLCRKGKHTDKNQQNEN